MNHSDRIAVWLTGTALALVALGSGPALVGAGGCSAAACHGSADPVFGRRTLGNEYATWEARDPHARAFETLESDGSRAIAERLAAGGRKVIPAAEDARCLACHSSLEALGAPGAPPSVARDGVGCESCHGAAGSWIGIHVTRDWDVFGPGERERRFGMVALGGLARRADRCAGCHVGEGASRGRLARDVNHDLIAAGHPPLRFEFSAFLANMPAHWREHGRNDAPDFPARAWAIGQAASARAAARLLESRARGALHGQTPWPELAEYACASCHHEIGLATPAASGADAPPKPTLAKWGTWYFPLIEMPLGPAGTTMRPCLARLGTLMDAPRPIAGEVVGAARDAATMLERWLADVDRQPFDQGRVTALIGSLRTGGVTPLARQDGRWDLEAQTFLALVPLRQALPPRQRADRGLMLEIIDRRTRLQSYYGTRPPGP